MEKQHEAKKTAVGRRIIGKKSGKGNIAVLTKRMGIDLSTEEAIEVTRRVKAKSYEKKGAINKAEFRRIVEEVKKG